MFQFQTFLVAGAHWSLLWLIHTIFKCLATFTLYRTVTIKVMLVHLWPIKGNLLSESVEGTSASAKKYSPHFMVVLFWKNSVSRKWEHMEHGASLVASITGAFAWSAIGRSGEPMAGQVTGTATLLGCRHGFADGQANMQVLSARAMAPKERAWAPAKVGNCIGIGW